MYGKCKGCEHWPGGDEVLLYVHRSRRFIRDGSPGRPPRLSHGSWTLADRAQPWTYTVYKYIPVLYNLWVYIYILYRSIPVLYNLS